jgi:hypothetical protein
MISNFSLSVFRAADFDCAGINKLLKRKEQILYQQKARTTRQLTNELKYVVERNTVLGDKMYRMEDLLKKLMQKYDIITEVSKTEKQKNALNAMKLSK